MVSLSSVSRAGGSLYLEIRHIELKTNDANVSYSVNGMVGDGCDEALISVDLGASVEVRIIPICGDDGTGVMLDERVGTSKLISLITEALTQLYFCVESIPGSKASVRVTGYADAGRLFHLRDVVPKPHPRHVVAESEPRWLAA